MRAFEEEILAIAYRRAVIRAARQTGFNSFTFPEQRPWTLVEILDEDFLPGARPNP